MPLTSTSLDGRWRYSPDPNGAGEARGFFQESLDDSSWPEMELPANWYLRGLDYSGKVWFRRRFARDLAPPHERVFLRFEAVDYRARVWLNGHFLGSHTGYFAPFEFEATERLRPGENLIAVEVDAPLDPGFPFNKTIFKGGLQHWDMRPGGWSRRGQERGSGGIWGSVSLHAAGPARISRMVAAPRERGGAWRVDLEVEVHFRGGEASEAELVCRLEPATFSGPSFLLLSQKISLQPGANRISLAGEVPDPKLWWTYDLGQPNLYSLLLEVKIQGEVSDQDRDRIGFRTIAWKDDGVYLNGRRVYLRGSCYLSSLWLSEMGEERLGQDLSLVKAANLNSLRIPYHVEPKRFYGLCDEQGILLWQDFALLWDYDTSAASQAEAGRQIQEMVRLLHNHPSIYLWCCHCEPFRPGNRRLDQLLKQAVAEVERSGRRIKKSSSVVEHPFFGWYMGTRLGFAALPGRPFPTEFGAQSLPSPGAALWKELGDQSWPASPDWDYHNFQGLLFQIGKPFRSLEEMIESSQRYQAELLSFAIQAFRRGKGRTFGYCLFTFVDAWPSISWSIVDYERRPKLAHAAVALASQPVKLSLDLWRRPRRSGFLAPLYWNPCFDQGGEFFCRVWVINDCHDRLENGRIAWQASSNDGRELFHGEEEIAVEPDSSRPVLELMPPLASDTMPGNYCLKVGLFQGEELLDTEELDFFITPPGGRSRNAWVQMGRALQAERSHLAFALSTFPRYILNAMLGRYR